MPTVLDTMFCVLQSYNFMSILLHHSMYLHYPDQHILCMSYRYACDITRINAIKRGHHLKYCSISAGALANANSSSRLLNCSYLSMSSMRMSIISSPFLAYSSDFRFRLLHGSPSSSISRLLIQIVGSAFSAK